MTYEYTNWLWLVRSSVMWSPKPSCVAYRYAITKAFCIAFLMTFFSVFDVPVFWPILFIYWIVLFILTMKRQIMHMIKYKYIPLDLGKQVKFSLCACLVLLAIVFCHFWMFFSLLLRAVLKNSSFHEPNMRNLVYFAQRYTGKKAASSSGSRND